MSFKKESILSTIASSISSSLQNKHKNADHRHSAKKTAVDSVGSKSKMKQDISKLKLSDTELKVFEKAYTMFDQNGDGKITIGELEIVLHSLEIKPNEQQLSEMFQKLDNNNNGVIDFSEFVTLLCKKTCDSDFKEELSGLFRAVDKDKNGFITLTELHDFMRTIREEVNVNELSLMMQEVDDDNDGKINCDEFVRMMMSSNNS